MLMAMLLAMAQENYLHLLKMVPQSITLILKTKQQVQDLLLVPQVMTLMLIYTLKQKAQDRLLLKAQLMHKQAQLIPQC